MRVDGMRGVPGGCIVPGGMECGAFDQAAWDPLHSIGMHFTRLHGLHCIQSQCMVSTASMTLHGIHCLQSGCFWPLCIRATAFDQAAWYPLPSIGMFCDMLHKIHCIQSGCFGPCCKKIHCIQSGCIGPRFMDSTAFILAVRQPLRSTVMPYATLHRFHCIQSCCMVSTAFNRDVLGYAA